MRNGLLRCYERRARLHRYETVEAQASKQQLDRGKRGLSERIDQVRQLHRTPGALLVQLREARRSTTQLHSRP